MVRSGIENQRKSRSLEYLLYLTGGLLVDLGVLTLKPDVLPKYAKSGLPHAVPSHPAIVEWRAMTVIELYIAFHFYVNNP